MSDRPTRSDSGPEPARLDEVHILESALSRVGEFPVRRALPRRARRMVGPWCFIDHMGPATVGADGLGVAPHPHIGLQTVTWLLAGEVLHRDSLGTEQTIVPGQLNLMTAGHGVSHSEEGTGYRGEVHGVQLWVAQPDDTRHGPPAFEHHAALPQVDFGDATVTVLVGGVGGAVSPARRDTDHVGLDLDLRPGRVEIPLARHHEHGLVVLSGACAIEGGPVDGSVDNQVTPAHLAHLGTGRDTLALTVREPTRALLVGGTPFETPVLMWWNYVARTRDEILTAHDDWTAGAERFGQVDSPLPRTLVDPPPWPTG